MSLEVVVDENGHLVVDLVRFWVKAVVDVEEEHLPIVGFDAIGRSAVGAVGRHGRRE